MKFGKLSAIAAAVMLAGAPALADLVMPALSYRTGPYAPSGIPFADGFADYITLLNERDSGIGGEMLDLRECETAYNTEKGVECYEALKSEGLIFIPQSTGITYQLIPKATADKIPIYSSGYGRTSATNGKVFEWVFNNPGTYWDVASVLVKYVMAEEGGDISGKKITLLYHNSAYGKEPIRTLEELSKKHGFELTLIPVDHPGQEQKSQWLQIRRDRPDWVFMWGWGVMNQVAVQEAANIRFPMDHVLGAWFSASEADVLPAGDGADGYIAANWHGAGADYPIYEDLQKYVFDAGKAAGDGTQGGTVLYNRGMYVAAVVTEVIRLAQKKTGKSAITPSDMRDAYEELGVSEERWTELGLAGFAPAFQITCARHSSPNLVALQQWDAKAKTWTRITDFMEPDHEIIDPLVEEDSMAYAAENNITPRSCE